MRLILTYYNPSAHPLLTHHTTHRTGSRARQQYVLLPGEPRRYLHQPSVDRVRQQPADHAPHAPLNRIAVDASNVKVRRRLDCEGLRASAGAGAGRGEGV